MNENKNAKTPADGPEYERGFVEGMQRQMQLHVNRVIREDPTAWLKTWPDGSVTVLKTKSHAFADHELEPLYTAPPNKEWVGLTEEDMEALFLNEDGVRFARYIEAKLREKNA